MIVEPRNDSNPIYLKLRTVYKDMMTRCNNPKSKAYRFYGAKGITVSPEWKTLSAFLADVDKIDGWNLDKLMRGELQLDKDLKGLGMYSVDGCTWLDKTVNKKLVAENYKDAYGLDPYGKLYKVTNISEFAEKHGLLASNISNVLAKRVKHHKHWVF